MLAFGLVALFTVAAVTAVAMLGCQISQVLPHVAQLKTAMAECPQTREVRFNLKDKTAWSEDEVNAKLGESNDIHPKDKLTVGHRLALSARHVAYGENIVYSGPQFRQFTKRLRSRLRRRALAPLKACQYRFFGGSVECDQASELCTPAATAIGAGCGML